MDKLALEGGRPIRNAVLPYGHQLIDADDERAVISALRAEFITTGPMVERFEATFAARVGARFAVAVSNGTAALHAAMFAAGVGQGDEVVVPTMTFAASANCVRYQQGTVAFVDVRDDTLNIDVPAATAAVNARTRAIVAVDFAGHPAVSADLRGLTRS